MVVKASRKVKPKVKPKRTTLGARTVIVSRNIISHNTDGTRRRPVSFGRPYQWSGRTVLEAYRTAVIALANQASRSNVGGIVYIMRLPRGSKIRNFEESDRLFQAKRGYDGSPFTSFYHPLGERMRVQAKLPARLEKWDAEKRNR